MSGKLTNYPPGEYAHGLMFHHFFGGRHAQGQGAISSAEFDELLDFAGADRILPAAEWQERSSRGTLSPNDLCITFDDALRCQVDIALPVLEARGITAFWFVYSSVFKGVPERLEIYRHLRTVEFPDIDRFYDAFEEAVADSADGAVVSDALRTFDPDSYLTEAAFYTRRDRTFRFVRDRVLGEQRYFSIMDSMVERAGLEPASLTDLLWMNEEHLRRLNASGHIVGLHSYSHPTNMAAATVDRQRDEYSRNHAHLCSVLQSAPTVMSHPCNSYSAATLEILRELGIDLGFRANMRHGAGTPLERPRADHADLRALRSGGFV